MRALPILAIAITSLSAANAAPADGALDGWRQFAFGMTPAQAQALPAPGQPWHFLTIPISPDLSDLTSLGPVKEFGFDFAALVMTFKKDRGLLIVALSAQRKIPEADCGQSYLALLPAVEARYGSFAALGFGLPPGGNVSIHDVPGAKSQYRRFDTSNGFRMEAVRTFGTRYISVRTGYVRGKDGGGTCFTDVWFQNPEPQP